MNAASGSVNLYSVAFDGSTPISYGLSFGDLLRGKDNEFTIYSRWRDVCTESNSNYVTWGVSLLSATFDATTGWKTIVGLGVTVATQGTRTSACETRRAGDGALVGGWSVYTVPAYPHITVAELDFMCIDENQGYVPTQTWKQANGAACTCSDDYEKSCK